MPRLQASNRQHIGRAISKRKPAAVDSRKAGRKRQVHRSTQFSLSNTTQFAPVVDDYEEMGLTMGDLVKGRCLSIFRDDEEDSPGNQSIVSFCWMGTNS